MMKRRIDSRAVEKNRGHWRYLRFFQQVNGCSPQIERFRLSGAVQKIKFTTLFRDRGAIFE